MAWAIILLLVALVAWIMGNLSFWLKNSAWLQNLASFAGCPHEICYGTMATYRVTAAAAIFHAILAILLIGVKSKSDCRSQIQDGWWFFKLLFLVGLMVASFFVPNSAFIYYGYVALGGAAVFIIIQLILLVDFAHSWNENWVNKVRETESKRWLAGLLIASIFCYVLSLVLNILMYIYFIKEDKDCWMNTMFITLNLILCFAFTIFSIFPKLQEKNPRSGLLQSAVVTAYCTYLVWSALASEPAELHCSSFPSGSSAGATVSTVVGLILAFVAVIYNALTTSTSDLAGEKADLLAPPQRKDELKSLVQTNSGTSNLQQTNVPLDPEAGAMVVDDKPGYSYTFFHVTFCLACMYFAMILTNWRVVGQDTDNEDNISVDQGMAAVWVKVVSGWVTIGLYVWSLIAPIVFPDRVFY